MRKLYYLTYLFLTGLIFSCGSDETPVQKTLSILSATINGSNLSASNLEVLSETKLEFVFSSAIDVNKFRSSFSWRSSSGEVDYTIDLSNAATKVTIDAVLNYSTNYTVTISEKPIGLNGEKLAAPKSYELSTAADNVIRSMTPCVSGSDCLRSIELQGSAGKGTFEFYSNYPIYEEKAVWENLTHAVIVVHGASHDPENYYSYMTNSLQSQSLSDKTILIAPFFRSNSTGSSEDFYWPSTNWRRGNLSSNSNKISSFEVIDALIGQLADKARFPVLKKIILTGHSSGAAFTHVFSASNKSEVNHPIIDFEYVVANAQFFYYPDGQRIDESSNQLYTPANCSAYTIWPLGYNSVPPFLTGISSSAFNTKFVDRKVTYLLGNGSQSDPTLNTVNCENIVQGSTRYKRGENMFRFMELSYPGTHQHKKVVVNGIGHDGQGMYLSPEFKTLLKQLSN